ncbi:MAG TPA: uroporphyrinogen decarboxylase [Methylomirabilota bacterium]|jgi:uroporphyrinogen decarboxylase|nr:uroporphyrinogen decarboxylase [Methylomirabilota bacterium]
MTQTPTKPLLRALAGERVAPAPIWLMRQAGRYLPEYRALRAKAGGFLDMCFTPEHATEITLQPIRRFGFDAAILFSDILVVPWALGQRVRFEEGRGPVLEPIAPETLERLERQAVVERLRPVFETVRQVRVQLPPHTALIGFAGAPWTVASYMIEGGGSKEFLKAKRWALGDPDRFEALIELLVEATVDYLSAQVEAGAEALQLFDSWAGVLSESELERWSFAPLKRIVEGVKARHPEVPVILFPRGAGLGYARFAKASGADGLSLDTTVPLSFAVALQQEVTVQGNLDPAALVAGGRALEEGVDRILEALGHGPFIFNLGHGVVPETPPEHVAALIERVRRAAP